MKINITLISPEFNTSFFLRLAISFLLILTTTFHAFSQPTNPPGMTYIPEGYFQMGRSSGGEKDERPMHYVYTSAFYIGKYEVSNAEYRKFVEMTHHPKPPFWNDDRFNPPDFPVVGVNWNDAMAYARWRGGRLPTEAEWEKAARGVDGRLFPWGAKWDKGFFFYFVNVYGEDDNFAYTAPTTYYEGGASPFGLLNMSGNVWEWCLDGYSVDYYRNSPERNPEGPKIFSMKVLRGGSWANDIDGAEVTRRARNFPNVRKEMYGFRIVIPANP
tara:strand:- start:128 stop:943 length:816 start_codon:yes stop_codon:yes gene_type:complete